MVNSYFFISLFLFLVFNVLLSMFSSLLLYFELYFSVLAIHSFIQQIIMVFGHNVLGCIVATADKSVYKWKSFIKGLV